MKLILFDIDGTLMDSGGAGTRAMYKAFAKGLAIGRDELAGIKVSMAGKTDPQILGELFSLLGIASDRAKMQEILSLYIKYLEREIKDNTKALKPAVMDVLDWLAPLKDVHLGLLTGNVMDGARIKLKSFGIWERFAFGAFGSDNHDRNKLLPAALDRFRELTGKEVTFADCVVIGDTPRDVECSKPYGAYALAVATGPYDMTSLNNTDADAVIEDLTGAREVLTPLLPE